MDKRNDTNWQLNRVDKTEWIADKSGIYCLINWVMLDDVVRVDVMSKAHNPIISFCGDADDVRKHLMRWFYAQSMISFPNAKIQISLEHAAYIGSELEKCDTERIDYVQS